MNDHNLFQTISGVNFTNRRAKIQMKINESEEKLDVFVVKNNNFSYDLLLGLDAIKKFKLIQNENLEILQKVNDKTNRLNCTTNNEKSVFSVCMENDLHYLDTEKRQTVTRLIESHESLFAKHKYDVGEVKHAEAEIKLSEDRYVIKKPYRTCIPDKKEIEHQISKLLEAGLIEYSTSPFASPVTLAFKREENKRSRLCIDFRELNKIVIPEPQPFPRIDDITVKAGNCKWYTVLDVNSAFWSIPIKKEDRLKTAFVTHEGHYQWLRIPFGLKTAPAIFQRTLGNTLQKNKLTDFCTCYIDDILIFSKTFEEHLKHIELVLNAVEKEGFKLKLEKCNFAKSSIKYLGHIIENNFVRPLSDNLKAIENFPQPKSKKNVRQFLGKINFYYKYLENAVKVLEPLHNLLRKDTPFIWSETCDNAFQNVKKYLCSSPILQIYDYEKPVYIFTDASGEGFGAVLKQPKENNELHPVAYFSKKLSPAQKKKKAIYLECMAIKEAIIYWQYWLIGRKFIVITDHKPLESLRVKARTDEELGDLVYYLSQYDFILMYSPGKGNVEADTLSRNPVLEHFEGNEDILTVVNLITVEEIKNDQKENKETIMDSKNVKYKGEIVYKSIRGNERIFLSQEKGKELIEKIHYRLGHIGSHHTLLHIRPHYYFPNMDEMVKSYCNSCDICKKNKTRRGRSIGLLSQLGPASAPYEIMSIDTVGGFSGNNSKKRYLHILVDHFSRFAFITSSSGQTTKNYIRLLDPILQNHSVKILLADQYASIKSKEFRDYLLEKGVTIVYTSVDCPQSNGLNERLNQTLVNRIRCKVNSPEGRARAWSKIAEDCTSEYNNTIHSTTRFTPRYLLLGEDLSIVPSQLREKRNLQRDREEAKQNSTMNHKQNKLRCDKNRRKYNFQEKELVYIEKGNKLNRNKLDEIRSGPFPIIRRISSSMYEVACGNNGSEHNIICHSSKLTPSGKFLDCGGEM